MGVCLSFCADKTVRGAKLRGDGKTLCDCAAALDEVAAAEGLSPAFSAFIFDPEAMEEELPEGAEIIETYYDPRDGLRVVAGLIAALDAPDGRLRRAVDRRGGILTPMWRALGIKSGMEGRWAEQLVAELRDLDRCLQLCAKGQARFFLLTC